jgi:NAD(P)-dependent dehydrogenase (short-subunit alcohol dehydrogenase family)
VELEAGQIAVVTGAGSGIGRALAVRFGQAGLQVVLADVDEAGMAETAELVEVHGVQTAIVPTDVSKEAEVTALAAATLERFGDVHVVCNNAGVASLGDAWFGPFSTWEWVMGVNLYGVVHGIRAFLPFFAMGGGERHFVNTASIAGLMPGFSPAYDASKHAVVAISEDLFVTMRSAGLPIGVSVLCPGWVRTKILDSERNWPDELGELPAPTPTGAVMTGHVSRAIDEATTPAAVADQVVDAVAAGRFWVIPHDDFFQLAVRRWEGMAQQLDPEPPAQLPGLPPYEQLSAEMLAAMGVVAEPPAAPEA